MRRQEALGMSYWACLPWPEVRYRHSKNVSILCLSFSQCHTNVASYLATAEETPPVEKKSNMPQASAEKCMDAFQS